MSVAALYYQPDAFEVTPQKNIMGRHAAGASFLRGFLRYSSSDVFWVLTEKAADMPAFLRHAQQWRPQLPVHHLHQGSLGQLKQPGCLFYPSPSLGHLAWQRTAYGHNAWSLCGITHTTASAGAMDDITDYLTAPLQPWDALICTSQAVKSHVEQMLYAQQDYLRQRLRCQDFIWPQLPVIPLGIHSQDFTFTTDQKQRARQQLQLTPDSIVVLYMGRLSFHAKAHPLAMYQALQRVAEQINVPLVLVECGWHANQAIADAFRQAAQLACPAVRIEQLDGRQPAQRDLAWAAADIFCSLSDNIQETFGITPLEAMAAGLPVVVSDWDGYRDTVRDGVDGFLVNTAMPPAGLGRNLALRHALSLDSYDRYCGLVSSLVAVDVAAASEALLLLATQAELRQMMGAAGQQRAQQHYDWQHIIPRYQQLWATLAEQRHAAGEPKPATWPARLDPFQAFRGYPSLCLHPDHMLALVDAEVAVSKQRLHAYWQLSMVEHATPILPSEAELSMLLDQLAEQPRSARQLVSQFPVIRQKLIFRSLLWLYKLNLLHRQKI